MSHINDCILIATGGLTVNDGLLTYYKSNGAVSDDMNDAEYEFLIAQGVAPAQVNDMWLDLYASLGYTGARADMDYQFWCIDGGATTPPVGRLILNWNGVDAVATFDSWNVPIGGDFTIRFKFTMASIDTLANLFSDNAFNQRIVIRETGGIQFYIGGNIIVAHDIVLQAGVEYNVEIIRINVNEIALTVNDVIEDTGISDLGFSYTHMIKVDSAAFVYHGVLKDIELISPTQNFFWALDSGSIVSEDSTVDTNNIVFQNVLAGDWVVE